MTGYAGVAGDTQGGCCGQPLPGVAHNPWEAPQCNVSAPVSRRERNCFTASRHTPPMPSFRHYPSAEGPDAEPAADTAASPALPDLSRLALFATLGSGTPSVMRLRGRGAVRRTAPKTVLWSTAGSTCPAPSRRSGARGGYLRGCSASAGSLQCSSRTSRTRRKPRRRSRNCTS